MYDLFKVPQAKRFDFDAQPSSIASLHVLSGSTRLCLSRLSSPSSHLRTSPGTTAEQGTGKVTVSLDCDDDGHGHSDYGSGDVQLSPGGSEARCQRQRLRIRLGKRFGALSLVVDLEIMSGDFWLGRTYIEQVGADVVLACTPVQFRVDASGAVLQLGIDARQKGEGTPPVWF
ncbi:hypothetical protein SLS62_004983 [Diatrype stigma]|uniref:Uncharacterized protein n=1 Tax=Diatrype stigma TaxID=117547 RepID=A0AAN9YSV2_9PEZI